MPGPIAEAYVDIVGKGNEAQFQQEILKLIGGIGEKIDRAFNFDKIGASATKAGTKVKALGKEGKAAGTQTKIGAEESVSGLKKVEHQLEKNINNIKKFEHQGEHASSVFKRVGERIVAAFSIYAIAEFAKKSVEVAESYERINRVVERAFETTHHVAGVTIQDFDELAAKMSIATGIGETSILKANEQLLAFTNIRNVVGKGNDIFTRAAGAVQDISIRTGLGAISIARSVGKALEDPAKASLVLRRASVLLTNQQKKQIETFEKSGNVLAAQRVILDAVEQKYGGAAKAAADPLKQLAAATNQIERAMGQALLPTIDDLANTIVTHLPQIKVFVAEFGKHLHNALVAVEPAFKAVAHAIGTVVHALENNKGLAEFVKYALGFAVAYQLAKEAAKAFLEIQILIDEALAVFDAEAEANPVGLIVIGLAALVVGLVYAYKHSERFRALIHQVGEVIKTTVIPALQQFWVWIQQNILPTLKQIGDILLRVVVAAFKIFVSYIKNIILPAIRTMISIFKVVYLPLLKFFGSQLLGVFKDIPRILTTYVLPTIRFLADAVLSAFSIILKGAAISFGWIPKIGPKLRNASAHFDQFKDDVNASLNGIVKDKTITIHVVDNRPGTIYDPVTGKQVKAAGSGIQGPTITHSTPTSKPAPHPTATAPGLDDISSSTSTKKKKQAANLTELIRQLALAINAGFTKGAAAATKTVSALEAKVRSALKGTLQEGLTKRTVSFIEAQRAALVRLAAQYDKTAKQTEALKAKVKALTDAAKAFKDSVIQALQQTSNLDAFLNQSGANAGDQSVDKTILAQPSFTGLAVGGQAVSGGAAQAKSFVTFLGDQAKQLTSFRANLNTLIKRIGDTAFVQDLASKGLASADFVASLAQASPDTLRQIDHLQTQILNLQHSIADAAGQKLQTAADQANALLLKSEHHQANILHEIKLLSGKIISGIAKIFGTKVPKFAEGVIADSPTFGKFAEAGREAIIPLTRPRRALSLMDRSGLTALALARAGVSRSTTHSTVNHNTFALVPAGDPAIHAQQVAVRLESMSTR